MEGNLKLEMIIPAPAKRCVTGTIKALSTRGIHLRRNAEINANSDRKSKYPLSIEFQ